MVVKKRIAEHKLRLKKSLIKKKQVIKGEKIKLKKAKPKKEIARSLGYIIAKIMKENKIPKGKTNYIGQLGNKKIDWSSSKGYDIAWKGKYLNGVKYQTISMKGFEHKIPKIIKDIEKNTSLISSSDGYYITISEGKRY